MAETETVSLNLGGSFAAEAAKDANAAEALGKSLDKLRAASEKANKSSGGREKNSLPTALQGSAGPESGFQKMVAGVARMFGDKAAAGLVKGAQAVSDAEPAIAAAGKVLSVAGGAVATGGAVVAAAAAALAAAAGALIAAGVKFGIEQTDAATTQKAILSKLGSGGGYKLAVKVAADLGIPEEAAINKTKALLNAKFKESQVESIIKVGIGLDAVQGEGAGDKFAKTLEKIKNSGKFDAKSMKQFAAEGINTGDIIDAMAKKAGVSVKVMTAKVQKGIVDVDTGTAAVLEVAGKKFGGVASAMANSIPGLIQRIKTKFGDLFKNFDLGPIKGALKNIMAVIDGPAGQAFSKAFTKLGNTLITVLFGPLSGGKGKDTMTKIAAGLTGAINWINDAIAKYGPKIKAFMMDIISPKKGSKGLGADLRALGADLKKLWADSQPARAAIWDLIKVIGKVDFKLFIAGVKLAGTSIRGLIGAVKAVIWPLVSAKAAYDSLFGNAAEKKSAADVMAGGFKKFIGMQDDVAKAAASNKKASVGAQATGKSIPDGMAKGILAGKSGVITASVAVAAAGLAAAKATLGTQSPSKAFAFVGAMNAAGMAKGMNDNASAPAAAGAKMAAKAAAGAAGGASAAKGGAKGGASGGGPTLNIVNNFAPGTTPAQAAAVAGANADEWKKQMRSWQREQQEGRAA